MFGVMGTQWKVTKAVRELVAIAGERGSFRPEMRDQMVKNILEFSRDLKMASTRLGADEQAMITMMAFTGTMGPVAFEDAATWCGIYAKRHAITGPAFEGCKAAAADLVKKME